MLTELYIEALLTDEDLADQVWELWDAGLIPDAVVAWAWCILVLGTLVTGYGWGGNDND